MAYENSISGIRAFHKANQLIGEYGFEGAFQYVNHILLFPDVMMQENATDEPGYEFWVRVKGCLEKKQRGKYKANVQ